MTNRVVPKKRLLDLKSTDVVPFPHLTNGKSRDPEQIQGGAQARW